VEVSFEGPPLRFRPGQFVYLTPLDPRLGAGRGEEHPYAIVSAAQETSLRIAIKNLGDASAALLQVSVGSHALIEGPYGSFLPAHYDLPALWIGGGIGLTPFVSAARSFAAQGEPVDVQLIYCANDLSRAYFLEELEAITVEQPGFAVHAHFFAEQGPLSLEFLRARVPDFAARRAFVCGPAALLTLVRRRLREAGVPRSRISTEAFDLL
jgi:predicted ferric reductase